MANKKKVVDHDDTFDDIVNLDEYAPEKTEEKNVLQDKSDNENINYDLLNMEINLVEAISQNDLDWTKKIVEEINLYLNKNSVEEDLNSVLDFSKFGKINKCLRYSLEALKGIKNRHELLFECDFILIKDDGYFEDYKKLINDMKGNIKGGKTYTKNNLLDMCRLCIKFKDMNSLYEIKALMENV